MTAVLNLNDMRGSARSSKLQVIFYAPYTSWEKVGVESFNGQYGKGRSFAAIIEKDIKFVESEPKKNTGRPESVIIEPKNSSVLK